MAAEVECEWEKLEAPDVSCDKSNPHLITKAFYTQPGHPLVLPTKLAPTETDESRLLREITRRLTATGNEKMYVITGLKATMPKPTPQYKTNPNTGQEFLLPGDTSMVVQGTEYRSNLAYLRYHKQMSNGQNSLYYFLVGYQLVVGDFDESTGTASGILATFNSVNGIEDGAEVANQLGYRIAWKGDPIPDRLELPL